MKSSLKFFAFAIFLIIIDQAFKLWMHFYGGLQEIKLIGNWFKLHYVTNPGMAFGIEIEHEYGKLFLTVFRLIAMGFISAYMVRLAYRKAPDGLLWAMAMILAGAIGNLLDSIFYGVYLHNAPIGAPSPWFHGQVIDMVFIDVWEGYFPEWVPIWGDKWFSMPIFNLADAFIFIGVCIILIFQGTFFPKLEEEQTTTIADEPVIAEAQVITETPSQEEVKE
jgi:signal peptidase II